MCRVPVASLGYATIEDIPVFHTAPGGAALRVVIPAGARLEVACPEWCGAIGELVNSAGSEESVWLECRDIVGLASRWAVDLVVIEGVEPLRVDGVKHLLEAVAGAGFGVGVRTQGTAELREVAGAVDVILFDYLGQLLDDPAYRVKALHALDSLAGIRDVDREVLVFMDKPAPEALTPVLARLNADDALHLIIGDPRGGGPAREVYERARRLHAFTYLHAPPYDKLETYCPKCEALVAVREHSRLVALKAPGGRCWRCGAHLPLRGPLYERTKPTILRRTGGGGTRWHDPRILGKTVRAS